MSKGTDISGSSDDLKPERKPTQAPTNAKKRPLWRFVEPVVKMGKRETYAGFKVNVGKWLGKKW